MDNSRILIVEVEGVAPYIMHKFVGQQDMQGTPRSGKKIYNPTEECEKVVNRDEDGYFIPGRQFKASMVKQAINFKFQGHRTYKDFIKAGLIFPENVRLDNKNYEIHEEPVVIQRSRVMSWRPKFNTWKAKFEIEVIDELLHLKAIEEILSAAGKYNGVGDHRPEYGRFKIKTIKGV